jgi:DNA-binding MarR family transcriptional regulator
MSAESRDRVDAILDQIRQRKPEGDLDAEAFHIRLRRISHWLETESRRRLAPQGIEFWELPLLSGLLRSGGSLGVGELQDLAQVTPGAITHRIAKLEAAGHVLRTFAPHDRRQVNVEITDAGRERFLVIATAIEQVESELFSGVDADLLRRLADGLRDFMHATEGCVPSEDAGRRDES